MIGLWRYLFGWVLLFLSVQGYAADTSLILTEAFTASSRASSYITQYVDILEDAGGKLTLEEVSSAAYDGNFTRNHRSELDLHFTRSAYWVRIRLLNQTPENDWYVRLPGSLSRKGDLYLRTGDGVAQPFIPQSMLPRFKESIYHLPLAADTPYTLYMRIQDVQAPMFILLDLHTAPQMLQRVTLEYPVFSFIISGLITLAFYNFMYFLYLRERSFLALSIAILTFALTLGNHIGILHYFGIFRAYFDFISSSVAFICIASSVSFQVRLFNIQHNLPRVYGMFRSYFWIACLLVPFGYFLPYSLVVIGGFGAVVMATMFVSLVLMYRERVNLPSSLLLGILIAFGSIIPALLRAMGVIGNYALLSEAPYVGLLIALILLSLTQAEQIRHSHEQAERIAASNQAKDEFLTTMSHELRTPMNAVVGAGNLLKITPLSGKQEEYVQKLEISSRHMLALINDILDLARADSSLLRLENIPFDLGDVLHEIEQLLAEQAHKKQLALTLDNLFQPADKPLLVGDPTRLKQVLLNLQSNAIKFTGQGHVTLSILPLQLSDDAVTLQFAVSDSGIGISAEQQQQLFQPFSQADSSTNRKYGGSGLGLAISHKLVERMGGKLELESAHAKGSRFFFTLTFPLQAQPAVIADVQTETAIPDLFNDYHILLVDDDLMNLFFGRELLAAQGIVVTTAERGADAIALLERQRFDLVFMDVSMPEMDGYQTTQQIRTDPRFAALPVIALTAHAIAGERERCLAAGMNDYLSKPFEVAQLRAMLKCWLGSTPPVGRPA
ncbi:hybrid sensor histidine kinase/response regulator [Thiothrix subterranea]|uniref:histidine kinase n=1 Tax=Thiothrix subterranea TaxID=2735563 RepID=A0AA51MPV8_9GAMM|nr:response regulator [Thiothrix subterranea]MDQ5769982.1 response regulator [Thiothrix subterranea]WML88317.1 response regulator [Thiothrix subterranea]